MPARGHPAAVSAGTPLGAPTVRASEGDTQSTLTLGGSADDNGATITHHQYDVNGNGNWQRLPDTGRITGLRNGTDYRFRVRAVNSEGPGPASAPSNTINPYGNPTTPDVSASVSGRTITWTWTASNGNGRAIDHYEVSLDGGGWQSQDGRRFERTFDYSETHRLRVRAVSTAADANRKRSDIGAAQRTTVKAPDPVIRATRTGSTSCDSDPSSTCTKYAASGSDLKPNTGYTLACQFNLGGAGWGGDQFSAGIRTNGAGNFDYGYKCHVGTNTQLRYVVRGTGGPYYSNVVTK